MVGRVHGGEAVILKRVPRESHFPFAYARGPFIEPGEAFLPGWREDSDHDVKTPPLHSASGISDDGPLAETQVFH